MISKENSAVARQRKKHYIFYLLDIYFIILEILYQDTLTSHETQRKSDITCQKSSSCKFQTF